MSLLEPFTFPVSGVHTWLWLPPLVAFCVSAVTSTAGITGAFLLLPFQISVLGFASPAVSATNLVYNLYGIGGGALIAPVLVSDFHLPVQRHVPARLLEGGLALVLLALGTQYLFGALVG